MNKNFCQAEHGYKRRRGPFIWLLMISLIFTACSSLPEIKSSGLPGNADIRERCRSFFPAGPYQFTHSIEARLPDESRSMVLGIVLVDPPREMIHSVIMTVEGFILFDARYHRLLTVNQAVAPFDDPEFAEKIMADIKLIFSPPAGRLIDTGALDNGFPVCRYRDEKGLTSDVLANRDFGWAINQYDSSGHLSRQVRAYSRNAEGIPERIELSRHQSPRYGLKLMLLQAERLSSDDKRLNY